MHTCHMPGLLSSTSAVLDTHTHAHRSGAAARKSQSERPSQGSGVSYCIRRLTVFGLRCVCRQLSTKWISTHRTVRRRDNDDDEEEEEEEEEGLFKADAVNEEDPERDRATQV